MSAPVLSVRNLTVRIGNIVPVQELSFDVNAGEVLGIVGESGSGKSLTLRAILRLLPRVAQTSGNIVWRGRDLTRLAEPELRARARRRDRHRVPGADDRAGPGV